MKTSACLLALCVVMLIAATPATAQKDRMGNFEIQDLLSSYNQMETLSSNLKALAAETMPAEYNNNPALKKAWNEQTKFIERLRVPLAKAIAGRTEVVDKDETITVHGREKAVTQFSALHSALQNERESRKTTFNCDRAGKPEALCAREAGSGMATGILMDTVQEALR